jgi:hypothetical protein
MLDSLPSVWLAALEAIRDTWRPYLSVAGIPGMRATADNLVAIGMVDYSYNGRYCTFTPWGAEQMGVTLYEWHEAGQSRWTTYERIQAIEDSGRGYKSKGERDMETNEMNADLFAVTPREWFADADANDSGKPSTPLTDEWGREVVLFGATVTRDEDQRRALKCKKKARKAG